MGQPIKLIVKKGASRKDGTSLIFMQYCRSSEQRVLLNTGIAIPASYWNKKTERISGNLPLQFGNVCVLQTSLTEQLRKAEDMIEFAFKKGNTCPMGFLKENFHLHKKWELEQMATKKINLNVYDNIDDYIKGKESSVKPSTINIIGAMKKHLESFELEKKLQITFDSFDVTFYENFVRYLTYEILHSRRKKKVRGLKINTVGKTIRHLKSFLRDRMRKKIIPFSNLDDYKVMTEEVDAVYLSWQEISLIYHLDLSANKLLEKCRDLFVLGCLTGFRFSDYSDIKPEEVRNGMLYVNQTKTLATIVVPLRPDAKNILIDKYNMQMPQVSNPQFNFHIKEVVKLAGIDENIKITHKKVKNN